ncbi:hypothetical protein BDQ17DRAFT_1329006 [Cyathus striatus]|nr:hypothetical protein BDQ17DRAFT_1329006 [Cyathus striatus]
MNGSDNYRKGNALMHIYGDTNIKSISYQQIPSAVVNRTTQTGASYGLYDNRCCLAVISESLGIDPRYFPGDSTSTLVELDKHLTCSKLQIALNRNREMGFNKFVQSIGSLFAVGHKQKRSISNSTSPTPKKLKAPTGEEKTEGEGSRRETTTQDLLNMAGSLRYNDMPSTFSNIPHQIYKNETQDDINKKHKIISEVYEWAEQGILKGFALFVTPEDISEDILKGPLKGT